MKMKARKKPDAKQYMMYDSFYIKYKSYYSDKTQISFWSQRQMKQLTIKERMNLRDIENVL